MEFHPGQGSAVRGDKSAEPARLLALDGLRGAAILMVLLTHCVMFSGSGVAATILNSLLRPLWLGVDLFFVLSGYLITRILLHSRGSAHFYRNFYLRRALRILPAYYLVLGFVLLAYPTFNSSLRAAPLGAAIPYLLFQLQNWYLVFHGWFAWSGVSHFWSLSVEEQFYLLWPFLIAAMPLPKLARLSILLLAASIAARVLLLAAHADWLVIYAGTITHIDGLVAGAWVAIVTFRGNLLGPLQTRRLINAGKTAFAALLLLNLSVKGIGGHTPVAMSIAIALASISFAALVHEIHFNRLPKPATLFLKHSVLVWLGRYSYGIYLIHYVVLSQLFALVAALTSPLLGLHPMSQALVMGAVVMTVTLISARLMYAFVEAPALRWSKRFHAPSARDQPVRILPAELV